MTNLNNVIGQDRAKNMLRLLGEGYRRRRELPSIGIFGQSGLGKCFAKGTQIRMYDGSTKAVENIQNGEYVMGDDSTPRLVYGTTSGREEMYEIIPVKGKPWRVNASHILVLVNTNTSQIIELSVREYLARNKTFQAQHKLYRVAVQYDRCTVKIDPYFVGLWLGDGDWHRPQITTTDHEIVKYLQEFADRIGMTATHKTPDSRCGFVSIHHSKRKFNDKGRLISILKNDFLSYGLMSSREKFIPQQYLINDRTSRLALLAGLLDSDGHLAGGCFEITSKWERLALQIQELAMSLGFYANLKTKMVNNKPYYRVTISGHLDKIPTLLSRKRATPRKQIKDVARTGFEIISVGVGEYFGFAVDGNNRFLLDDFTVTHNTHLVDAFAEWLDAKQIYINGTAVSDALAFRAFFREAEGDQHTHHIVFIDECHRLPKKVQDNLLSVLEKPSILCTVAPKEIGVVKFPDGTSKFVNKGDVLTERLPKNMSFILATTDPVEMKPAVLTRLRKIRLEQYTEEEKSEIAMHHMSELGCSTDLNTYMQLAKRSRNIRHLKDDICATFMDIDGLQSCNNDEQKLMLLDDMLGLDEDGANDIDRDYMEFLAVNKIASVETLAKTLMVDVKEIKGSIEPFLFEKGWVTISGRGRKLTVAGYEKITGGVIEGFNDLTN